MAYDRNDSPRDERFRDADRDARSGRQDGPRGDRGFFERAGDEISSWFGDEEAERRRDADDRSGGYGRQRSERDDRSRGERGGFFGSVDRQQDQGRRDYGPPRDDYRPFAGDYGRGGRERGDRAEPRGSISAAAGAAYGASRSQQQHDPHYAEWRQRQIDQLDADYDDYRREHQSKFDNDFSGWRGQRQSKRQLLGQVREHMDVVGSDEQAVGRVDKVIGDKVILTKDSEGANGIHRSLSCALIDRVEGDRLFLSQPAEQAQRQLTEERGFQERSPRDQRGEFDRGQSQTSEGPHNLERSFSGTYRS